jgi:hypothetical protein
MIFALFAVVLAAGGGYAQEMPEEIKAFLDNYLKSSTNFMRPLDLKNRGVIPASVELKDIRVRAFQVYEFKGISFNDYPDNVALNEIIFPTFLWRVLVIAHNKPLYDFWLNNKTGEPKSYMARIPSPGSEFKSDLWGPLLKVYPESTGIKPVLVSFGLSQGFTQQHYLLYFPQLGSRKIYNGHKYGFSSIDTLLSASIETLDDSKTLIKYLKKREANGEGKPIRLEKTKAVGSNDSAEQKEYSSPRPILMRGKLDGVGTEALFPVRGGEK